MKLGSATIDGHSYAALLHATFNPRDPGSSPGW
jgi:hypothetical protein